MAQAVQNGMADSSLELALYGQSEAGTLGLISYQYSFSSCHQDTLIPMGRCGQLNPVMCDSSMVEHSNISEKN
jgi:hypothetical protein